MLLRFASSPLLVLLVVLTGCATRAGRIAPATSAGQPRTLSSGSPSSVVRPGLDVLLGDLPTALRGKRIGLITNHSAVDRNGVPAIDRLAQHPRVKLVALLAPEHGIRGTVAAGEKVGDEVDARTGVPVHSLYQAEDRGPTAAMLANVDVLVYDLQEVGGRTWTYVSTMALSMRAAAARGIPFVVLDRPNPIGDGVEGALIAPGFTSFVGMYPIPARHGMTVGELAAYFNHAFAIGADLVVVRVDGWQRDQWRDETGLPWVNPSPNLRSLTALIHYPGTVYFEGTNLTEGRGTDRPFEQIGAPWLDAAAVAATMNAKYLAGVRFEPGTLAVDATAAKFPGQSIPGIRLVITNPRGYRPVRTALILIDTIKRQHPAHFEWGKTIDRLTGSDKVRQAIDAGQLAPLLDDWDREADAFRRTRAPYLLYR